MLHNSMKYDLIIYDCDGTLVDTHVPVNQAFLDRIAAHGFTQFDLGYIERECMGISVPELMQKMSLEAGRPIPASVIKEYQSLVPEYLGRYVRPDPAQISIIQNLGTAFRQCVASNGLIDNVAASLHAAGLASVFGEQAIFVAGQVGQPKPSPDLIHFARQEMGGGRAAGIEDSVPGVQALVAAGVTAIGFTGFSHRKTNLRESLELAGAHHVFDTWPEIDRHLRYA